MNLRTTFIAAACTAMLITSCGKSGITANVDEYDAEIAFAEEARMDDSYVMTSNSVQKKAVMNGRMESVESPAIQRKLILNGYSRIEVESISDLDQKINDWAESFGGYISFSDWTERTFNACVKIPSDRFYDAMNSAGNFGKVKNHNINTNDVTDEYYDLETRIETKKILRDKLQGYLKQAKDLKDMLEIERQLNSVQSELESIEGRMKRLSNQIDFSTISLDFYMPAGQTDSGFEYPDYGDGFRDFGINVLKFFKKFVIGLCYVIVYGIPIAGAALLFFWLLFGKIGIIRKLFNKLKK